MAYPLKLKSDTSPVIFEAIALISTHVCGLNSIRHPHQLADTEQDLISWTNIFDNFTSTVPSSTYEEQHIQDTFPKTQDISDIAGEDYSIPLSIHTISNDTLPSINIQETTETSQDLLTDISSSTLSSIMEQDFMDNDENIGQALDFTATRENEISSRLDEANILPENDKRTRKVPRRDIFPLARNYETFHLVLSAIVNKPVIIGRKLPFISTMKPPPGTWKQMIRNSESDGFKKAAGVEWNTLIEKDTLEMITTDGALRLEQQHK
ncbi:hypothetical protein K3495_g7112 [Podosphaera aphanis]|nr:hypothetical protein K3495_g7112 [Podosphaera aphanis]